MNDANQLLADEMLLQVGMDRSGCFLSTAVYRDSPCAAFIFPDGEEADESKKLVAFANEADQATRDLAQLEERRGELQQALDDMNQRLNMQSFQPSGGRGGGGFGGANYAQQMIAQRDMIRMNLAQVVSSQKELKGESGPDKKALEEETQKKLQAAK